MPLPSLPNELLYLIAEELEASDLNSFLRIDRHFKAILTPLLTRVLLNDKNNILLWAAKTGDEPLARRLLDYGAVVNYGMPDPYMTPLMKAVDKMHLGVVKLLLDRGANTLLPADTEDSGPYPWTRCASVRGSAPVLKLLLDADAFSSERLLREYGKNLLHEAVAHKHVAIVELLLDRGVAVDTPYGGQLLELAIQSRSYKGAMMAGFLVDRGAIINSMAMGIFEEYGITLNDSRAEMAEKLWSEE